MVRWIDKDSARLPRMLRDYLWKKMVKYLPAFLVEKPNKQYYAMGRVWEVKD